MGVVYKARQVSLGRMVAVKIILGGQFVDKKIIQRFRAEVTAAALLQHPNIVQVHEVGMHAGQHFFSMEYVEGQNLAQLVGTRPLLPKKAGAILYHLLTARSPFQGAGGDEPVALALHIKPRTLQMPSRPRV